MKNVISTKKTLFLAAAVSLGLAAQAFADQAAGATPPPAPAPAASDRSGQLGQSYVKLGYSYMDVRDSDVNVNGFNFAINQNVREGVDTLFEYDYWRTENLGGGLGHATENDLRLGARGFMPLSGGLAKPYGEAGLGWSWTKIPTLGRDNSFTWFAGAGVELEAISNLSITPFVRYNYAVDFDPKHSWDYGVRSNYWFSERAGVELKVTRDNSRDMTYGAAFSYRY